MPVLEIQNLELAFSSRFFKNTSLRDQFVKMLRSPVTYITEQKKTRSVLKNINLTVNKGDRIALIGINGSGKTSLCRCISGTLRANRGQIQKTAQAKVLIQTDAFFFPELTGYENAQLLAQFLYPELTSFERENIVTESLEFTGLGDFIHSPMESYSMGMKSRISLSLVTARPHELLILDEIYTHADEFFQNKLQERLKKQVRESDAVIMVSHYEKDLMEFCNRGIVLHEGEIKYDGKVDTALKAYRFMNGGLV